MYKGKKDIYLGHLDKLCPTYAGCLAILFSSLTTTLFIEIIPIEEMDLKSPSDLFKATDRNGRTGAKL